MLGDMNQFYTNLQNALKILEEDDRCKPAERDQNQQKHDAILKMVAECIQKSCEMNNTVECLKDENLRLASRFNNEKAKCRTLHQKLKKILKNQELFMRMKDEYQAMSSAIQEQKIIMDKEKTSASTFFSTTDKYVQVQGECQCAEKRKSSMYDNSTETTDVQWTSKEDIPRLDVDRLDEDINTLKELLNERELIWGKLATRERIQRLHLSQITLELEVLRQANVTQRTELELKDKVLQELTKDLGEEGIQTRRLKKYIAKLEKDGDGKMDQFSTN